MKASTIFLLLLIVQSSLYAAEKSLTPPDDPRQSISYWKEYTIRADQSKDVALAESVFRRLLRAWDSARVEPGLYVVESEGSAWAASLADGNILLSRGALATSLKFGVERGEHLLAFVLAHELAHQRSDDLWHQRFFRHMRTQTDDEQALLSSYLALDSGAIKDIQQKEVQADRDGLITMASVGFDPWQVIEPEDFFTEWVETSWDQTCDIDNSVSFQAACMQARSRALRSRFQIETVASQSAVYDLGVQALVASKYSQARRYFTLFGREFPGRAVMSAIGISYLAEAMEIRKRLIEIGQIDQIDFYLPLMLDASAGPQRASVTQSATRASADVEIEQLNRKLRVYIDQAVEFLERAIRLDPEHKKLYLSLSIAHLIDNNSFLVRGVLQGRYRPRFGDDAAVSMLLAMTSALEGDMKLAEKELNAILKSETDLSSNSALPVDLVRYATVYNLAALYRFQHRQEKIDQLWKNLADVARIHGDGFLFRLAIQNLGVEDLSTQPVLQQAPTVKGVRPGDRKPRDDSPHKTRELWIEGESFIVYIYEDGARYVSSGDGKVISASQIGGNAAIQNLIKIGSSADRPLKALGLPDRRLHLSSGEYIAYDNFGLALHIDNKRVVGWFLYQQ